MLQTEVIAKIAAVSKFKDLPQALGWLVKMYGPEVNVCVSHGRALQLLCLRLGVADVDERGPPVFVSYVASAVGYLSVSRQRCDRRTSALHGTRIR